MGDNPQENDSPKAKRKKEVTGREILAKLKQNENDVNKVVREMIEELCPFDINDEEALGIEDRLERFDKVANLLKKKVWKLQQKVKQRKFKHKPELLDEKVVSSSQYSLLDLQEGGDVDRVRALGQQVNLQLVQLFPWIVLSPSVHRILAHSWEVMLQNDCYGLGDQSEEGLEALNKYIRRMRSRGARKDSTLHNFTDTCNHPWDRSRPVIVEMERKIKRRPGEL